MREGRRRQSGAAVQVGFIPATIIWRIGKSGARIDEVVMKMLLLIVVAVVVLGAGSALAVMNNACKSTHHAWCAPVSDIQHHTKTDAA